MLLPCSVGLLLPGVAALLLARRSPIVAVLSLVTVAALAAWARAAGYIDTLPAALLVVAVVGGVALLRWNHAGSSAAGGGLLGLVAGVTWAPCVGQRLGHILTDAPSDGLAQLVPMLVYVLGVYSVLIAVALLPVASTTVQRHRENRIVAACGIVLAALLASALAVGRYTDVLATFAQISTR